jgi:glycosyltransferase involved in cell wall biosynthesis
LGKREWEMGRKGIGPDNTVFVVLSFEGPDAYSLAGGLGVRVDGLAKALASMGFPVHLFFIGDPRLRAEEMMMDERLALHRWCQWISQYYPRGVYEGENEKLRDFNHSVPWFVSERVVKPAARAGKLVVILGEEWHTAEAMCRTSDALHAQGIRDRTVMFWNANNTLGFDRINWGRLSYTTTITTVSRYMKQILWKLGINPLVIPNGIPASLLGEVDDGASHRLRRSTEAGILLSKVARYHPDKRWNMAVEATGRLKAKGERSVLLARGGIEPHGGEVMNRARGIGLNIEEVDSPGNTTEDYLQAVQNAGGADYLNLRFHCPQQFLRIIYRASDAVLANSGHEPFGLVGLEAMAAGGIAFTGSTGEDYAVHLQNSIVLDTADPQEIESYITYLQGHPEETQRMRRMGRDTAGQFTWERVLTNLIHKLEYQARIQGLLGQSVAGDTAGRAYVHIPPKSTETSWRAEEREQALAGGV